MIDRIEAGQFDVEGLDMAVEDKMDMGLGAGARADAGALTDAGERSQQSRPISAVLFDMDGTLIDSERLGFRAWHVAGDELGVPIDDALIRGFVGITKASCLEQLTERLGSRAAAEELFAAHERARDELATTELTLKPGAREVLEALDRRGVYLGLATSTSTASARATLERMGLARYFDGMTFGDEVAHGKPAPDIYLKAAARAGVDPAACAVVEDSPNGTRAGHAAGMRVYLVPDTIEPDDEIRSKAAAVLDSLFDLEGALEPLLA